MDQILLLSAQSSKDPYRILGKDIEQDKLNHAWLSMMGSFTLSSGTYFLLSDHTDLSPLACKLIGAAVGFGGMIAIGWAKEKRDTRFNPYDMEANKIGAAVGTVTFELIIFRGISERAYRKRVLGLKYEN